MSQPTKRLGRGLSSLISSDFVAERSGAVEPEPPARPAPPVQSTASGRPQLASIRLSEIRVNPHQPRKRFDEAALQGLALSLRERGALQPVVVRRGEVGYELVAGERRFRAAHIAGLTEIPAIIRQVSDEDMLELALIENVQRVDLNPVERARGYALLHDRHKLTHEQIAQKMGEDRVTVTNFLRLLQLPGPIIEQVEAGELGAGHARVLLALKDPSVQIKIAVAICREGWSVRKAEAEVSRLTKGASADAGKEKDKRPNVSDLEQRMSASLGTRVSIREGRRRHTGKLVIEYFSLDDFERITERLGIAAD